MITVDDDDDNDDELFESGTIDYRQFFKLVTFGGDSAATKDLIKFKLSDEDFDVDTRLSGWCGYDEGITPIMIFAKPEIRKILIKGGAFVSAKSEYSGYTPLMYAQMHTKNLYGTDSWFDSSSEENLQDSLLSSQILIDAKADVNDRDYEGCTALFYASTREQVNLLIRAGANASIVNDFGITAGEQPQLDRELSAYLCSLALLTVVNSNVVENPINPIKIRKRL